MVNGLVIVIRENFDKRFHRMLKRVVAACDALYRHVQSGTLTARNTSQKPINKLF